MTLRARAGVVFFLSVLVAALCLVSAAPRSIDVVRGVLSEREAPVQGQAAPAANELLAKAETVAKALKPTDTIPSDPAIAVGKLPNGMRYYIRENKLPEKRGELRLAVNAGSVLEDKDQLGLAHFVEHEAFNGSKNFPDQAVVNFMQSIGMRFGPSVNAYTSFDETIYMLQVPTDKPEVIEKAMAVLEDWSHNITFDPKAVQKERGVIGEEWRLGRGADARMRDKQFPVLLKGSLYAERIPIGTKESIDTFKREALLRFYHDWYRPDLMAVVAVGDFDKASIEALIKKDFGAVPAVKNARPRPLVTVPPHPGTLYTVATDKEATNTMLQVYNKMPAKKMGTVGVYRQMMVERLASGMLSARLADISRSPDSPFAMAAAGRGSFVRSMDAAMLMALPKDGQVERSLETLIVEANRAARFGFVQTEVDRQKATVLRTYERYFAERDKHESAQLAAEYIRNFLVNETVPTREIELALHRRFLPEITLEELNKCAKDYLAEANRVVTLTAPEKPGLVIPDEKKLAAAMQSAMARQVTAYDDGAANMKLMDKVPEPGRILKTTEKAQFGITEWELSNGMKVVLKPTTYKEDEILFRVTALGGSSLLTDADYEVASNATDFINRSVTGLSKFSAIELRKILAGKIASASPYITDYDEGIAGSGSPKDIETMFQLIYLTFTAPRADAAAFAAGKAQQKAMLANQKNSPQFAFAEMMNSVLTQDHPRGRMLTAEAVDKWDLDKSMAFYKDRFADASHFTVVFVGSFTPDSIKPYVERYLASLPSLHRTQTFKDVGPKYPSGVIEKEVKKGAEPQSQVGIAFTGPFVYNRDERVLARALSNVVTNRLRIIVREKLGGTYGIGVSAIYDEIPREQYQFRISWGCNPDRVEELTKAVFADLEDIKKNGPTEQQMTELREGLLREFETSIKQNQYLIGQIYLRYRIPRDLNELFTLPEYYKTLTPKMIQDAANKYINMKNYVKGVLYPESKTISAPISF